MMSFFKFFFSFLWNPFIRYQWGQRQQTFEFPAVGMAREERQLKREQLAAQVSQAAAQLRMQQRQWEWQKGAYARQELAGKQAAGSMAQLVSQYNLAYQQAKAANEQRYQEMLGITGQTTGQRAADIRSAYAGQAAAGMQQLARQGMAGTTVAPTMQMGYQREQESALNRLAEQMQGTRLGIMERRQDVYPDPNVLISLAQAIGQGGMGASMAGAMGQMRMT